VVKILKDRGGERVNLSVFECEFKKPESFEKLKGEIKEVIKPRKDHIRYYVICAECREKIDVQGWGTVTEPSLVKFA
jgi:CRISPR-associated endonuclease Cas2